MSFLDVSYETPVRATTAKRLRDYQWVGAIPFILVHLLPLLAFFTGTKWQDWVVCVALYWIRMFGITGVYHRYFSHRTYKTSRWFQFVLALLAMSSSQKGVLWWAANHRTHHKLSDQDGDPHDSRRGFWYSHVGWLYDHNEATDYGKVKDLARYPELVFLNKLWFLPPLALGSRRVGDLGLVGLAHRLLPEHRRALARHLHDQLALAHLRHAALRRRRHQHEQLVARDHHDGRRLAQQPPPLHGLDAPGLLLVGVRLHLLHPARAFGRRSRLGHQRAPAARVRPEHVEVGNEARARERARAHRPGSRSDARRVTPGSARTDPLGFAAVPPDDGRKLPTGRLKRLVRMAGVGARAGAGFVLSKSGVDAAEYAADVLGTLRGLAAKVGQTLSYVDGIVPEAQRESYERAMAKLRNAAPHSSSEAIRHVVEEELGGPVERLFASFDPEPFASASIGQVHRARLPDGRAVAVKVQHPGIATAVESDLKNAGIVERLVATFAPKGVKPKAAYDEVAKRFREELDYELEAEHQRAFAAFHAGDPKISIPAVIGERSARRVLTSELSEGLSLEQARR